MKIPPYVPYFYIIKTTPVQLLAAAVTEELVLILHGDSAPRTLWKLSTPPIRAYNFHFPRPCGFIIKMFHIEQKCTISHTISQNHFRRNFSKRGSRGAHLGRANAPGGCPGPRTLRGMHAISHEKCIRIKRTRMQKHPKIQNCEKT